MDNYLVPRHVIDPKEEVEPLLLVLATDLKKLPKILPDDPIVIEIDGHPGDVIQINRFSHTAAKSVYYRVVEQ